MALTDRLLPTTEEPFGPSYEIKGGLEMGLFGFGGKKPKGKVDQSRRDFLKKAGTGIGGVAAAGVFAKGLGFGNEAHAGGSPYDNLPPGFANSPFEEIREAAAVLYGHHSSEGINHLGEFLLGGRDYPNSGRIKFDTNGNGVGTLDPAYYMLLRLHTMKVNESNRRLTGANTWGKWRKEDVEDKNPAMYWFHLGLIEYFKKWVNGDTVNERVMENYFLKAIFIAAEKGAYPSGVDTAMTNADNFQNSVREDNGVLGSFSSSNPLARVNAINGLITSLNGMSSNPNNHDPNEGYYRKLVAAWSSYLLTFNEQRKLGVNVTFTRIDPAPTNSAEFYGFKIERPIARMIGNWIRGEYFQ